MTDKQLLLDVLALVAKRATVDAELFQLDFDHIESIIARMERRHDPTILAAIEEAEARCKELIRILEG